LKIFLTEPAQTRFILDSGITSLPKKLEHFQVLLELPEHGSSRPGDIFEQIQSKAKTIMRDPDVKLVWGKPNTLKNAFNQLSLISKAPS
jgi:hypothetical protein